MHTYSSFMKYDKNSCCILRALERSFRDYPSGAMAGYVQIQHGSKYQIVKGNTELWNLDKIINNILMHFTTRYIFTGVNFRDFGEAVNCNKPVPLTQEEQLFCSDDQIEL